MIEPEPLGVPHGAHVDAEPLEHLRTLTEGELRAPAAGIEDHEPAVLLPQTRLDGEVGEPPFLVARDHLDRDPRALVDRPDDVVAIPRDAHPRSPDPSDRPHAEPTSLVDHAGDRIGRPRDRRLGDLAGLV